MATVYDLLNADSSEVEEQRVIRAPGATAGDVLTVQANGTIDPAPSSGFTPVTCFLQTGSIDIHTGAGHPLLWAFLLDNAWDFNALIAIPTRLGLTFAFDGTAATITTTEAGTWGFSLALAFVNDATWTGYLSLDQNTGVQQSGVGTGTNPRLAVSETVTYPSGANFVPTVFTELLSTANPLNAQGQLTIVRLA